MAGSAYEMGWLGQPYSDTENKVGITLRHLPGTDQELEVVSRQDGLILQDPKGMTQQEDMGGTDLGADADDIQNKVSYGVPFVIEVTIDSEETGAAITDVLSAANTGFGGADVFPTYDSTADARTTGAPFKFKMLDAVVSLLSESAASVSGDTLLIQRLNQAGTVQADWTNAMVLNVADHVAIRPTTLNQDSCVIDVGENIRFDMVLADSSNHATCVKVYITCMRCIADE